MSQPLFFGFCQFCNCVASAKWINCRNCKTTPSWGLIPRMHPRLWVCFLTILHHFIPKIGLFLWSLQQKQVWLCKTRTHNGRFVPLWPIEHIHAINPHAIEISPVLLKDATNTSWFAFKVANWQTGCRAARDKSDNLSAKMTTPWRNRHFY